MKTTILILTLILSAGILNSQTLTDEYMKKIPALPKDSCNISKQAVENFQQKVSALISEVENEIESLKQAVNQRTPVDEQAAKAQVMQQMAPQYNLSPEQMAQMKAGKMSAADKQAMANQILQQQTNMSMGEVQNLSKMSESGRKAYAEALGAEMMATSQAGSGQQSGNNNAKTLNQLINQQQSVQNKIYANAQKIGNEYNSIESDAELQKSYANIEKWQNKIMSLIGAESGQGNEMDRLISQVKTEQIKICNNCTPKYRKVLGQHLVSMKASIPDIYQLGQITAQMTKIQTGIDTPTESTEIGCLEEIKGYLNKLADAFKFKLYYPELEN